MRSGIIIIMAIAGLVSCKSNQKTAEQTPASAAVASIAAPSGTTVGRVSHQYAQTGCPVVVVVSQDGGDLVLIPKDALSKDLDVDGLEIRFNYRTLKMPQPSGCTTGIPAELTDITKK